ncbi:MAG: UDP-N-acetylmuramoyl-L-alanine--D-glutamate ligase [Ignavibacteriae bacterium]|nr:UDP-N-acetylmuramoyl-L-alanine--D-glutamate ligase [Ignavibacteriota bacterium]
MDVAQLKNTKVSIIGAARSGVGAAKLLQAQGATVFVSDQQPESKLAAHIANLTSAGIAYEAGGHTENAYDCSLMVISPGVPSDAQVVKEAQKRGIKVVSELEAASWFCRARVVAITGSNGKTTTTTLLGKILEEAKKKHAVAGNIGTAFSGVVQELTENDVAVLEVSSFQLDHIETFRPKVAVIMNITPDHMDRYGNSMEKYSASKARVFMNQTIEDTLIYDADDEQTVKTIKPANSRKLGFSAEKSLVEGAFIEEKQLITMLGGKRTAVLSTRQVGIPGTHNLYNVMAATLAAQVLEVNPGAIATAVKNFRGVEHRLEYIRDFNGVKYYNDSKATNVDSVRYALQAFSEPIVVLLGGRDKGNDYSQIVDLVKQHVRAIVAIGESAEKVETAFKDVKPVTRAESIEEAVTLARDWAEPGDVVVLSPACASFDWFENYEHRGKVFKELVNRLAE